MYRRACRLFPGSHVPLLCMGMEYLKVMMAMILAMKNCCHSSE